MSIDLLDVPHATIERCREVLVRRITRGGPLDELSPKVATALEEHLSHYAWLTGTGQANPRKRRSKATK